MWEIALIVFIACPIVRIVLGLWSWGETRSFLRRVPEIQMDRDLDLYKNMVRMQMFGALIALVLLLIPSALYVLGSVFGAFGWLSALPYFAIPALVPVPLGLLASGAEEDCRSMKVAPELKGEYKRVSEVWVHNAFPDW